MQFFYLHLKTINLTLLTKFVYEYIVSESIKGLFMSVLHKIFSSTLGSKPSVHLWQPSSVSLYFKNSLSSKYKLLNLKNYDCLEISTQQDKKENQEIIYKLNIIAFSGDNKSVLTVATFETQEELDKAVLILRNKLFSPGQVFLKISLSIILSLVSILIIFSLLFGNNAKNNMTKAEQQELIEQFKLQENFKNLAPQQMPQGLNPMNFTNPNGGPLLPLPSSQPPLVSPNNNMSDAIRQANEIMNQGEKEDTAAQKMYAPSPKIDNVQELNVELPQDPKIKGFMDALN